jgi:hypothetical protein
VVCEGRIVGRIMLTNVPAPYWSWTLAYSFHEGRTPTRGHEATIEAAVQAFARSWNKARSRNASKKIVVHPLAGRRASIRF